MYFRIVLAALVLGLAGLSAAESPITRPSDDSSPSSTTQPAQPQNPTTRISIELLQHLQGELKNVQSVESDFVQQKNLAMLNHTLTIRGHFALRKPDRFIWIVQEPVRYAIRVDGDEARQWDQDTNRVDVTHLGGDPTFEAVSAQIQAWFLGDYQALAQSYDVDVLGEKPLSLSFTPKADTMVAKILARVDVTFDPGERYIDSMLIDEAGGDTTSLKFVRPRINQPIDPQVWRMPPNER